MTDRKLREECGVFGIFSNHTEDLASLVYYGLYALQHRGQESAGIVVNDDGIFRSYKDVGLVNEVFNAQRLSELGLGNIAIGHVRYGTTGTDKRLNAQPIVVNHIKGRIALAHNGNLTNSFGAARGAGDGRFYLPHHFRHRGHLLSHHQGASDLSLH